MRFILWATLVFAWVSSGFAAEGTTGVVFFGDSGSGEPPQYKVASGIKHFCEKERCDFVALLGDNFYPSGVKSADDPQWGPKWKNAYSPLKLTFRPALGNHDYKGNWQAQIDYSKKEPLWQMPERYYTFNSGEVGFFVIDTENFDVAQRKWLTTQLDTSKQKWKVVYGHKPVYSYGAHGDTKPLVTDLLPILKNRANFYLCGHDHDKQVLQVKGDPMYVVTGTASESRPVKKGEKTLFSHETLGFSHLEFKGDEAKLRVLDAEGATEYEMVVRLPPRSVTGGE